MKNDPKEPERITPGSYRRITKNAENEARIRHFEKELALLDVKIKSLDNFVQEGYKAHAQRLEESEPVK